VSRQCALHCLMMPMPDLHGTCWYCAMERPEAVAVYTRVTHYDVTIWPPGLEGIDSEAWKVTVEYRGHGQWSVNRGRACLNAAGEWNWERIPSERDDDWLAAHRFSRAEALRLARDHAPHVVVNGVTVTQVLARHQEPPGA
jgi:hypothetical protein